MIVNGLFFRHRFRCNLNQAVPTVQRIYAPRSRKYLEMKINRLRREQKTAEAHKFRRTLHVCNKILTNWKTLNYGSCNCCGLNVMSYLTILSVKKDSKGLDEDTGCKGVCSVTLHGVYIPACLPMNFVRPASASRRFNLSSQPMTSHRLRTDVATDCLAY